MSIKSFISRGVHYMFNGIPNINISANISYLNPNQRLSGKKIIITGGGRGLGFAMAKKFIDEGAVVLIAGRNEETLKMSATQLNCKSHDIKVQAYSPVCQMRNEIKEDIGISEISKNHNKTINQIILKWHIQNGIIPIFMTSKIHRVQENCDIFNFNLTKNEMEYIDSLNQNYKIFVESICCPGC